MTQTLGFQRDWIWRGWQIRYTYLPAKIKKSEYPPLIFIHGFGASIPHWRKNLSTLSENYTVYAIDLLGFGASEKVFTQYNTCLWAELIFDFWQSFINVPVILIGNSLGSLVALTVSYFYSEMMGGLVMINLPDVSQREEMIPSFLLPLVSNIEKFFANPLLLKPLFFLVRRPNILKKWTQLAYYDQNTVTPELINILATPPLDDNADSAFCALVQSSSQPNFSPSVKTMLSNLRIPILLIWGRQDKFIPVSLASCFCKINPNIELELLENLGHCPHDENPDRFNHLLVSWLQKIRG